MTTQNSGIYITGHAQVNATNMAAGPHAQAHSHDRYDDARGQLAALIADMRAAGHLDLGESMAAAEEISQELDSGNPEPGRVRSLLSTLTADAGQLSTFVTAIAAIEESIRALLP